MNTFSNHAVLRDHQVVYKLDAVVKATKFTNLIPKKLGHCTNCEEKRNAIIYKSHKLIFYSQ